MHPAHAVTTVHGLKGEGSSQQQTQKCPCRPLSGEVTADHSPLEISVLRGNYSIEYPHIVLNVNLN